MKSILFFALFSTLSFADQGKTKKDAVETKEPAVKTDPCAKEKDKFCPGMKVEEVRYRACMKGHIKDLSTDCQREIDKIPMKMMRKKWMQETPEPQPNSNW